MYGRKKTGEKREEEGGESGEERKKEREGIGGMDARAPPGASLGFRVRPWTCSAALRT